MFEATVVRLLDERDEADLHGELEYIGWHEALHSDQHVAVSAVMHELGRRCMWSEAFDDVMRAALSPGVLQDADARVVVPWPRSSFAGRLDNDWLAVRGLVLGSSTPERCLIPVTGPAGATMVSVAATALSIRRSQGLDDTLPVGVVEGVTDEFELMTDHERDGSSWAKAEAVGRLALSHYSVGALQAMLGLAREHAVGREQFGRPVGSFQAVRHKLAESLVAVTSADHAARAAWDADDVSLAAATAKLVVSRAVATVVPRSQQVLAGIGFTAEHPFHHYMKRRQLR